MILFSLLILYFFPFFSVNCFSSLSILALISFFYQTSSFIFNCIFIRFVSFLNFLISTFIFLSHLFSPLSSLLSSLCPFIHHFLSVFNRIPSLLSSSCNPFTRDVCTFLLFLKTHSSSSSCSTFLDSSFFRVHHSSTILRLVVLFLLCSLLFRLLSLLCLILFHLFYHVLNFVVFFLSSP